LGLPAKQNNEKEERTKNILGLPAIQNNEKVDRTENIFAGFYGNSTTSFRIRVDPHLLVFLRPDAVLRIRDVYPEYEYIPYRNFEREK
jgi:hypothetical protein